MKALELGTLEDNRIAWQVAHEALSRLARARAAADAEEGRWLLAAERAAVHVHLGYGSFSEYIERLFGYQPRSVQERLRVAETLEGLPALARALSNGELSWSAVRELTRVAVSDTEQEWLEFARGKTLRQLEQVLAHRQAGDTPASPPDLSAKRYTLRFDVAAETLASFREAMSELRRRAGTQLDDDSALLELARCVLGGPSKEGRASYQVVLSVCPECGNGRQQAAGELVPVGPHVVSMAQCDAQHIGAIPDPSAAPANEFEPDQERDDDQDENRDERAHTSGPATAGGAHVSARRSSRSVENPTAQLDVSATHGGARVSAQRSSSARENPAAQLDASATQDSAPVGVRARSSSSPANQNAHVDASATQDSAPVGARARRARSPVNQNAHVDAFASQDSAPMGAPARSSRANQNAHVDASSVVELGTATRRAPANSSSQTNGPVGAARELARATQTIPPALRRAAVLRDQHRCQVPGCRNACWVDVHHIQLRSEKGGHCLQNLVCVCGAHHRAAHHGQITLERSESGAIHVRHADGAEYGRNVHPQRLELRVKVFSALRQLGFREAQVRAALAQLPCEPAAMQGSFDGLLRAALALLRTVGARR